MLIWELSQGSQKWLFTERALAVRSIKMSYSNKEAFSGLSIEDGGGNTILVSWDAKEGGVFQDPPFHIEKVVDGHVYTDVEHL